MYFPANQMALCKECTTYQTVSGTAVQKGVNKEMFKGSDNVLNAEITLWRMYVIAAGIILLSPTLG